MHRTSHDAQDSPTQQRIIWLKTASVLRLRNLKVKVKKGWDLRGRLEPMFVSHSVQAPCRVTHRSCWRPVLCSYACTWPRTWKIWKRRLGIGWEAAGRCPLQEGSSRRAAAMHGALHRPSACKGCCFTALFWTSCSLLSWPSPARSHMGSGMLGNVVPA